MTALIPKNAHVLNDDNYYSTEAGKKYLSVHALMLYLKDPSLFWLKQNGVLPNTSSDSANAGKLFHAFMHNAQDFENEVRNLGKEPFTTRSKKVTDDDIVEMVFNEPEALTPKSGYKAVWEFIQNHWHKRHEIWKPGEYAKELILVGTIGDAPFKGRLDALKIDGENAYIYDYKTIALKTNYGYWKEDEEYHEKTFVHEYNYDLQMTAYAELVKQNFPQVRNVFITFGLLIKGGKHEFTEYPTAFVDTETVNIRDMASRRFDGYTPFEVLDNNALKAYVAMNLNKDEFMAKYGESAMMQIVYGRNEPLPFSEFRLR